MCIRDRIYTDIQWKKTEQHSKDRSRGINLNEAFSNEFWQVKQPNAETRPMDEPSFFQASPRPETLSKDSFDISHPYVRVDEDKRNPKRVPVDFGSSSKNSYDSSRPEAESSQRKDQSPFKNLLQTDNAAPRNRFGMGGPTQPKLSNNPLISKEPSKFK
eukprot:TRINITY_DN11735_c0_g2_i2.p1 TRINITY_DN11735_c0_g2~~TRINITY_DN11735_c0_g2_i2.p1  ORF type:complete len:174 (+),score=34.90 TRINITY_DN11735_c0_g2_i2:47-523(+)